MTKNEIKEVKADVSIEVWKKLKILSIQKDITLNQCVKELLEKLMTNKKFEVAEEG